MLSLLADLVRRYSFSGQQRPFTRFVAWASMLGMVLGVASLIVVLSVMNGFSNELHQRILSVVAHGVVLPADPATTDWQGLAAQVLAEPSIVGAMPFINATVLLRAGSQTRGAQLRGVEPSAPDSGLAVAQQMTAGRWQALADADFSVVLGRSLARILGVTVGDRIEVVMPTLSITPMGAFPRRRELLVVGEFAVGAEPDAQQVFVSLDTAKKLLGQRQPDGLQLRFRDVMAADRAAAALRVTLPAGTRVVDWSETQSSLFAAVRMEKATVAVLLLSVIAVAAFNIVSTLTMSVTEKRADIAVLRVLGLSSGAVMGLFMAYGMALGVIGIFLGGAVGVGLALSIDEVLMTLEQWFGFRLFDPTVYYIGSLPSELQWLDVLLTLAAALLLSLLATVYPAYRAARIPAAEALRRD